MGKWEMTPWEIKSSTPQYVDVWGGIRAIAAGNTHSVALNDRMGAIFYWGDDIGYPMDIGDGYDSVDIEAWDQVIISLGTDGTVYSGQLRMEPGPYVEMAPILSGVTAIAQRNHNMALKSNGMVWVWGNNSHGQLGDGTRETRDAPIQMGGLTNVVAIAAGEFHSVAIRADGTVWTWGANGSGQLGNGTTTDRLTPVWVSFGEPVPSTPALVNVQITPNALALPAAGSVTATALARVYDGAGNELAGETVTYSLTTAPTGVTINGSTGVITVTSSAKEGTVTVKASCGTVYDTAILTLTAAPARVEVTLAPAGLNIPKTGTVTSAAAAKVYDAANNLLVGKTVAWSLATSPTGVSINSSTGVVTVTSAAQAGTVTVRAACGTVSGTAMLTVAKVVPVKVEVTLIPASLNIPKTGPMTAAATAKVYDAADDLLPGQTVTWSLTPSPTGVTINSTTGVVTVTSAAQAGTVTVKATCGTVSGTAVLTLTKVVPAKVEVTLIPASLTIPQTGSVTANATAVVKDAANNLLTGETLTYSLTTTPIGVSINASTGVVTVTSAATAGTVTVKASCGAVSGTATLTVIDGSSEPLFPTDEEIQFILDHMDKSHIDLDSPEILRSFSEGPDYILASFYGGGYGILLRSIPLMLEYSQAVTNPYSDYVDEKKYYFPSLLYFVETDIGVINVISGELLENEDMAAAAAAGEIQVASMTAAYVQQQSSSGKMFVVERSSSSANQIPNAEGFLRLPFGRNVGDPANGFKDGSCGPLAGSLLLTYYNRFVDTNMVPLQDNPVWHNDDRLHSIIKGCTLGRFFDGTAGWNEAEALNIYLGSDATRAEAGYHARWSLLGLGTNFAMIDAGTPMIFEMLGFPKTDGTTCAHAVVAYGYSRKTIMHEEVYEYDVHTGWHSPSSYPGTTSAICDCTNGKQNGITITPYLLGTTVWLEKYPAHSHSFTYYKNRDADNHYLLCRGCDLIQKSPHIYGGNGKCTAIVCPAELPADHTHTYPPSWSYYTYEKHSKKCENCSQTVEQNHTSTAATKFTYYDKYQHKYVCTLCRETIYVKHDFGAYTQFSSTQHMRTCPCGFIEYSNHSAGSPCIPCGYAGAHIHAVVTWTNYSSSQHKGTCTGCGQSVYASHAPVSAWSREGNIHWKKCVGAGCGYSHQQGIHTYGTSTTCSTCLKVHSHSAGAAWNKNASQHWNLCSVTGCSAQLNVANHVYGSWANYSSTQHKRTCACDYSQYGSHAPVSAWSTNTGIHWKKCVGDGCGYSHQQGSHAYNPATGKCSTCEYAHSHTGTWANYTSTQHRRVCPGCGFAEYGYHAPVSAWSTNTQLHWRACVGTGCAYAHDQAFHVFNAQGICNTCKYKK